MSNSIKRCPKCKTESSFILAGKARKGFSFFKAILGAIIIWPIGIIAGLLGKKRKLYICKNCGFKKWH